MKKENRNHILFRYVLVTAGFFLLAGYIVWNMFSTTIIHADDWNRKADSVLSVVRPVYPTRGDILACDGSVIATNLQTYTVRIDYQCERFQWKNYVASLDSLCDSLARYYPSKTKADWKAYMEYPLNIVDEKKLPRGYKIVENISYADYVYMRTNFPFINIPNRNKNGVTKDIVVRRKYPYGVMAARTIGIVGEVPKGYKHAGQKRGAWGLEKDLDSLLYGTPGVTKKVALTKNLVNWVDTPAVDGYNVMTTIDIKMQDIVEDELQEVLESCGGEWGAVLLLDVKTGDIKAIANLEREEHGTRYIESRNRAVDRYEPGSVVKTLSMLIALEDGLVPDTARFLATGSSYAYAGGRRITDAHGVAGMKYGEVLERSSNIGMTKIITSKYGADPGQFYSRIKGIGFLEPMNTGIAEEVRPRIDSLPDNRGGRISLSRQCYGYATEISPLYMVSIYNAIANGGKYVRPRLVKGISRGEWDSIFPVEYVRERICSEENAAILRDMLRRVVWGKHGTGRFVRSKKVAIAGKTGTCFVVDPKTRKYNTSKKRLAFCGFFPAENPQYSCVVLICDPSKGPYRGAGSTSGQVMKNIAECFYSRGMLGNSSDYNAVTNEGTKPTLYATYDTKEQSNITSSLNIKHASRFITPVNDSTGVVPDVKGLGVREAVKVMERGGYNVEISGSGYVMSQTPEAKTALAKGGTVKLRLVEI